MRILGQLLVLLAVLLMALGMQSAGASPPASHQTIMAGAMEHCPDPSPTHEHDGGITPCAMACAAALPAHELVRDEPAMQPREEVAPMMAQKLFGMQPDIPTPPPKNA